MDVLNKILAAITFIALAASAPQAAAQQVIGTAAVVVNRVTGIGARVRRNEVIETGPQGRSQFIFADETVLDIAPFSKVTLDELVFDPNQNRGNLALTVVEGAFRFISGTLAKESYRVKTPSATIGIRGTVFDLVVENTGATTVVLRQGAVTVTNLANVSVTVDTPGLASTVQSATTPPTPPAAPSASVTQRLAALSSPATTGAPATPVIAPAGSSGPPVPRSLVTESAGDTDSPIPGSVNSSGTH
jgi:hypothetical protein